MDEPFDSELQVLDYASWQKTPLGEYVAQREQAFFDHAVADRFGYYAVQVGNGAVDCLRVNRISTRVTLGMTPGCTIRSDPAHLPFPAASIDLLALPHTLDFHPDPHQVLREAERVLVPEGRLLITGFNPWSLWGLARTYRRRRGMPWRGQFLSLTRVKDWLALLGLEPAGGRIACYVPPVSNAAWLERFQFMELAGNRWWPVGGAVYCLEAVKRVRGMRLIAPKWKTAKALGRPVAIGAPDRRNTNTANSVSNIGTE
ncbi:MAG: methyltransferase domain-containing protein [Burkholderiales bacterium]|nr:methyltransferase domain-containing protein [Burkholderiales bacterium]